MKLGKIIFLAALLLGLAANAAAKEGHKPAKVYMFGFAASFNDSTVYFTSVQPVDAYVEDNRTHFLYERDQYAYQLRSYLQTLNRELRPTCVVVYADNEKKAMKKYVKMQARYTARTKNHFLVNAITDDQFRFKPIAPYSESDGMSGEATGEAGKKPEKKAEAKADKPGADGDK